MFKKGQWARAQSRSIRTAERLDRLQETKQLYIQGWSADRIAARLGISGQTVRQYLNEVKPIILAENRISSLQKEFDHEQQLIEKINSKDKWDSAKINALFNSQYKLVQIVDEMSAAQESIGRDASGLRGSLQEIVVAMYQTLYGGIILSLHSTMQSPANRNKFSTEHQLQLTRWIDKWKAKGAINRLDYEEFLHEAAEIQAQYKIPKLTESIHKIEHIFKLNQKVAKLDNFSSRRLPEVQNAKAVSDFTQMCIKWRWLNLLLGIFTAWIGVGWILIIFAITGFVKKKKT
jgi:transposase